MPSTRLEDRAVLHRAAHHGSPHEEVGSDALVGAVAVEIAAA